MLCVITLYAGQSIKLFSENKYSELTKEYGDELKGRLDQWKILVRDNRSKTDQEQLTAVNDFFNQNVRWIDDKKLWDKKDYWATPLETVTKAAGDCEDFSIAKYYTLYAMGMPIRKLKITYVKALEYNQAHMVLTYHATDKSEPLVLDNINKKILKGSQRKDLLPVYSFDGEGLWLSKQKKLGKKVGSSQRIRLWSDLLNRITKEFE
jgi:predicted transglutaminase-like cysteine proteinase